MKAQLADVVMTIALVDESPDDDTIVYTVSNVFRFDVDMTCREDIERFVEYISNYEHVQHDEQLVAKS